MALCVQCGKEFASDRPGVCYDCAHELEEEEVAEQEQPEVYDPYEEYGELYDRISSINFVGFLNAWEAHPEFTQQQVADLLLEESLLKWITRMPEKFTDVRFSNQTANYLIKNGRGSEIFDLLDKFPDLVFNTELAKRFIDVGMPRPVLEHWEKFKGLDTKRFALDLIRSEKEFYAYGISPDPLPGAWFVARNLSSETPLVGLDKEVADALIDNGQLGEVIAKADQFEGFVPTREHAVQLVAENAGWVGEHWVFEEPEKFHGLKLDAAFAMDVLNFQADGDKNSARNALAVIGEWSRFEGDMSSVVDRIEEENPDLILAELESVTGLSNDFARGNLEKKLLRAKYLKPDSKQFPNLDRGVIVEALMHGYYDDLKADLGNYPEGELSDHERQVWEFFTDEEVPLRVKKARETTTYLQGHRKGLGSERPGRRKEAEQTDLSTTLRARMTHALQPIDLDNLEKELWWMRKADPESIDPNSRDGLLLRIAEGDPKSAETRDLIAEWMTEHYLVEHGEDETITQRFRGLRNKIGGALALEYLNRPDLSLHDGLEFWPSEQFLFTTNTMYGLPPELQEEVVVDYVSSDKLHKDFFNPDLLRQVAADNAAYDEGTAHHRFGAIYRALTTVKEEVMDEEGYTDVEHYPMNTEHLVEDTLEAARRFPDIQKLQALVADFEAEGSGPFDSWKALKKFYDLSQLVEKTEVLQELSEGKMSPKLRTFVERLAFHPNIAMGRVVQFWREPAEFLNINDEHTERRVNAAKKPSNYISLPYLGLRAEDLRDAYVEGAIDRLQLLPPMEMIIRLGVEERDDPETSVGLHRYLREAVGQARKGIEPKAQRGKLLFSNVQKFCKAHGITFKELWDPGTGPELLAGLQPDVCSELHKLVFEEGTGMKQPELGGEEYRARIGYKSDPDMTVAGNDTASCMPFGSGKNNVYMFNPNCVQMVVERKTGAGNLRTAAQSVVTIDLETTHPTPELIAQYQKDATRLKELLNEQDLLGNYVVTCDNIEVAKNEEGSRVDNIREVYQRFFTAYLKKHGQELGLDPRRVAVGQAYTPKDLGLKAVDNTFIPLAPMGYSDNSGEHAYLIETGVKVDEDALAVISKGEPGISDLRVQDVIPVAVLEGKAYADNKSVLENLHGMQNNLIGMKIANEHFGRPNLSFMYRGSDGVPRGYMLAYEGRNGDLEEVYISDIASDVGHPSGKLAGGQLIRQFFEAYTHNYGGADKPFLPIAAKARGETSYRILQRQLERLAKKADLQAELVVVDDSDVHEGETFYHVRVFVGRTQEEIDEQKERFESIALNLDGAEEVDVWGGETDDQYGGWGGNLWEDGEVF